jgi:hypothetical protein
VSVEYTYPKELTDVRLYESEIESDTFPTLFRVTFRTKEGKLSSIESHRPPLISLAGPDDSGRGYVRLARLFAQADMRNITRNTLFRGATKVLSVAYRPSNKFDGGRELVGLRVSLYDLNLGLIRAVDKRLGFYD